MDPKQPKSKINKVEEPSVSYPISPLTQKGIDTKTFDFQIEIQSGLSIETAKQESVKRIRGWWEK
ncbi:hypothetical protein [Flavobacterium ammonificans]|uniref:Uncharacterized protein n=1 Tax=Flavobacterium ammonificans TaxID=1751056 RepID=A0ABM7UWZ2_9FLAO|nr:hypothetical protein [Flavobacterium ammonificans]BDB51844.1 hypothetical protein GENT11_01560 [Flavobacterium ammonificans]